MLFFFECIEIHQDGLRLHLADVWNKLDIALLALVGAVMYPDSSTEFMQQGIATFVGLNTN